MKYKLKEIFDLQMGKTPARNNDKYWNTKDYKWISIADLTSTDKYINNTKEYISRSAVKESGIKIIPANTVVMSFKLSIGKTAILSEDMYSNEAIMAFHDKHVVELLPEYTYYLIKAKNWNGGSNRAVMGQTLNKATLSEIEVDVHTIDEQRKIVELLNLLGKIIYKRNTQLSKLRDILSARFVEIFGDPIINEKDWDVVKLNNACDGIGDGLHGTPKYDEYGVYPFINGNNLKAGVIEVTPITKMVNKETYKKHCSTMNYNTILLSINGTLGKLALYNGEEVMLGKSVCYCNLKSEINREFVYGVMNTDAFKIFLESNATASTIKNVGLKAIRGFKLILPPKELQIKYVDFVKQVNKSKVEVQKALDKAQLLFDSLMQKYFG